MSLRALGFVVAHLTAFLLSFLIWVTVLFAGAAVALAVSGRISPDLVQDTASLYTAFGAGLLGVLTLLQNLGLVAISAALGAFVPLSDGLCSFPQGGDDLGARWRRTFAVRPPAAPLLVGGALAAITVGLFPSWIAERLMEIMPEGYQGTLDMIPELLASGPVGDRALLALSIVVGAPLFEELVFRGYLWSVFERVASPVVALVATSLLFALFHADPVHTVSLLPTAFLLGWLRLASGSVWPPVAAHFVNNGLGAVIMFTADPDVEGSIPLWLALLGLATTCAVCALAWQLHRRREAA